MKILSNIDLNKNQVQNALIHVLSADPGSPTEGQIYYNSTDKTLRWYSGAAWRVVGTLDQVSAPAADVSLNSHKITSLTDPSNPQDAATKAYVDGLVTGGVSWKNPVRAATTAAGTLATSFENTDVIDGVTLATGDRILIKNQAAGAENGIYVVAASGAPTRATDADSGAEMSGAATFVEEGTANADSGWVCTNDGTITLGSTNLTFVQWTSLGQITAGNGLTKTGAELDVGAGTGISVGADTVSIDPTLVPTAYAADIGDGSSTSVTVTHNLGSKDVIVVVYDKTTPFSEQYPEIRHTSTTAVTLVFSVAPTSNQYRVVVMCLHG